MEVEYSKSVESENANFILPETEKALNLIIGEICFFFSVCRFVLQIVYIAYLVLRIFFMDRFFIFTAVLAGICVVQLFVLMMELVKEKRVGARVNFSFRFAKRIVSLAVAVIVVIDIFVLSDSVKRWQGVSTILICLGWLLSFCGDLFSATVPRYVKMILSSFKQDIEPSALATRSLEKVKKAAGHMAKRKAVRSWRSIKTWFSDLISD